MGGKGCRHFTSLEVTFIALFLMMTAVAVGLITIMAISNSKSSNNEPETKPTDSTTSHYLIGVGRADCTGPLGDLPLMGYANPDQTAGGLHTRLYSRAFIVAEPEGTKRVVFVSADIGMVSQRLRLEVLKKLKSKYGDQYRQDNVILSGTHTHSGPAGYFQYTIFMITSKGYIKPSINAIINGIVKSIDRAHQNVKAGRIFINKGEVENSSINRSPHSYRQNPQAERNRYKSNTDTDLMVLKLVGLDGNDLGAISWFAVHPVSMNNTNRLVNSDNMGYASYLFEQEKNVGWLPGEKGPFVAAFASTNLGDVSPNTKGPHCVNTGESCDNVNSYCPIGGSKMCMAMGPGRDMFHSTQIIGEQIYKKSKELYMAASQEIKGPLHTAHQWVKMSNVTVQFNATHSGRTCKPALGYSFAAGTIDGVGSLNFTQGAVDGDPFWDTIRDMLLGPPSNETVECHHPKPILFSTGEMSKPLPWHPDIVDIQIATIGSLAVVAVPGEFTTMSGRRLREAVKSELELQGALGPMDVVIAGLCNVYTHYITTYEEYQVQRYEAASTIYGPHTLSAYIQHFRGLAKAIAENTVSSLPKGPEPPFFNDSQLSFPRFPDNPIDRKPASTSFGDVLQEVEPSYKKGDIVEMSFVSGNPRNSVEHQAEKSFLTVEKHNTISGKWEIRYNDASWETRFYWTKRLTVSNATIQWHIPHTAETGLYRIQHFGHYKTLQGIKPYGGTSLTFEVLN
ncbi:neutral ceramidase [Latimeria chalumnae]|uniref:neutral ceramidase n=1 Tax=Latimeria chalumnae TaxID=7897 RepID=UPI0003C1053C|nr:PREDICTED: neutral ceramidase [Latimeria chalumnae]|eukprot:XP_006005660.1 PREDICTED: neutral ceramidase [Latimeria chalumnae]